MKVAKVLSGTIILSLSLGFAGCASTTGNPNLLHVTSSDLSSHLLRGRSTEADVINYLGEPMSKQVNEDGEYWSYAYTKAAVNGLAFVPFVGQFLKDESVSSKSVQVLFGKNGILKSYTTGQTAMDVR